MPKVYSGINYIDALLSNSGEATAPVLSWSTASTVGGAAAVTYDWMTAAPSGAPAGGFEVFSSAQRAGAINAMALISDVANITFSYQSSGTADIEFGTVAFGGSSSGYQSGLAATGWTLTGFPTVTNAYYTHADVYLTNSFPSTETQTPGSSGFATMLHELGHAIGLDHTFDGISLPTATDSQQYSVMSYTNHPSMSSSPSGPLLYDVAALQYLYGANTSTRTGNDTYSWDTNDAPLMAIWDAGGTDTISASGQTRNAVIDLNTGAFSSIGSNGNGGDAVDNIAIAFGAVIENGRGGSGNDTLTGNSLNNDLRGDRGDDTINGGGGADKLYGDRDNDTIHGGAGNDRVYGGNLNDVINGDADADTLVGDAGADTIHGGTENDRVYGGSGNDMLFGDEGVDLLAGSGGDDQLNGGTGNDRLLGGPGNNTFIFDANTGADRVFNFQDDMDTIQIDSGYGFATPADVIAATIVSGSAGQNAVIVLGGGDTINVVNWLLGGAHTIAQLENDILIV